MFLLLSTVVGETEVAEDTNPLTIRTEYSGNNNGNCKKFSVTKWKTSLQLHNISTNTYFKRPQRFRTNTKAARDNKQTGRQNDNFSYILL